jgi:hypothetical protein
MQLTVPRVIKNWAFATAIEPCTQPERFVFNARPGRRYAMDENSVGWDTAFAAFNLTPTCVEPRFKNMTTNHYLDGAFTHEHIDTAPEGFAHVRCNVILKKPPVGGNPIIDGERIEVEENDLWLCLASLERHASEPIQGGERVMFSFGGLVPLEQVNKILA